MKALRLLRVGLNVSDLARAQTFYTEALGFHAVATTETADPALAALLGARTLRTVLLQRGGQFLELSAGDPPGAPYPQDRSSNDPWFQHCALVTDDMQGAFAHLQHYDVTPISRHGPQRLPGGIVAYKFRDADGHPLELIQFPKPDPATAGGIDHSAISVADTERSIVFYAQHLGLSVAARQVNTGPAQDAMDGLDGVTADVVALAPAQPAPHVELLGYRTPRSRAAAGMAGADIAASRLVFRVDNIAGHIHAVRLADGTQAALSRDPDGHALLLLCRPSPA